MRAAWLAIAVSACASAGSRPPRVRPPEDPGTPAPSVASAGRWTVERVLGTVPDGVALIEVIEVARIRDSKLVGGDWAKVIDRVTWVGSEPYVELCPGIADTTKATIVGVMDQGGTWTVWVLGTPAAALRECWEDQAFANPDDYATWDAGGDMLGMTTSGRRPHHSVSMIVDDTTTLVRVQPVPPMTGAMRALMEPAETPIASAELEWALRLRAPIVAFVHGAPPALIRMLGAPPIDSAIAIDVGDGLVVHARTVLADDHAAAQLLDGAVARIPALQKDGVLGTADASRDDQLVTFEATMDRDHVRKVAAAVEARLP